MTSACILVVAALATLSLSLSACTMAEGPNETTGAIDPVVGSVPEPEAGIPDASRLTSRRTRTIPIPCRPSRGIRFRHRPPDAVSAVHHRVSFGGQSASRPAS